jgi:hypothetical protein
MRKTVESVQVFVRRKTNALDTRNQRRKEKKQAQSNWLRKLKPPPFLDEGEGISLHPLHHPLEPLFPDSRLAAVDAVFVPAEDDLERRDGTADALQLGLFAVVLPFRQDRVDVFGVLFCWLLAQRFFV